MKKLLLAFGILSICIISISQEIQHEAVAVNIEVPVRVYKGDKFIDTLTINDFELREDGVLQKIDAMYLIKKTDIERKEEEKEFSPQTERHFYLFFEIVEFDPKMEEALSYFFNHVLTQRDTCTMVTPLKTYTLKPEAIIKLPKEKLIQDFRAILRKDAWMGSAEYRSAVADVRGVVRSLNASQAEAKEGHLRDASGRLMNSDVPVDEQLQYYRTVLEKLEVLRRVDQKKLLDFANYLSDKDGQKYVFLFYQREFIPQISDRTFNNLISLYQGVSQVQMMTSSLFALYRRDISIDVERVKQAYSDSSIAIHFLFFSKMAEYYPGVKMAEHSEDIFSIFNDMAIATGGLTTSSANPEYLFKTASEASENYYLLYYTPKNYKIDLKFKNIIVKVKGNNYRITHRIGYIAD